MTEVAALRCTTLVVGAGPGGYVAAIRLAQLGVDTVVADAQPIGGTCLNVGCIPSKALIHAADEFAAVASAVADGRYGVTGTPAVSMPAVTSEVQSVVAKLTGGVSGLVKSAGARALVGRAEILDGKTAAVHTADGTVRVHCEHLVLATGSRSAELPALPFGGDVLGSSEALFLDELPRRLVVVGAGYIGLELGTAFAKLGSAVTIVEFLDRILPQYDHQLTRPVATRLKRLGVEVLLGTRATGFADGALHITAAGGTSDDTGSDRPAARDDGSLPGDGAGAERAIAADTIPADKVLVTVGRVPATDGFGLDRLDLDMDGRYVRVDGRCRTSMRNVWAIGDLTGEPMLAHRAMAQGAAVAELIAGRTDVLTQWAIPAVCYTDPEIVTAGLLPDHAAAAGIDAITATSPLQANGRALTLGRTDGMVRVVARRDNHAVVGLQAVGAGVGEFASTFALALEMGARLEDLSAAVAAHPTLGEVLQEAALSALGTPRHTH